MRHEETELLRSQLLEARADQEGDAREVASLAGLLARLSPDEPLLAALGQELRGIPDLLPEAVDALERLLAVDRDAADAESWDALCAFDELCAAATFLGSPELLSDLAAAASQAVRSSPGTWSTHSAAAAELLRDRSPLPGDPSAVLWAAVQATGAH